jgi:peptide deformylase
MRDSAFIRLKIVQTGEPVLRQVARQVPRDEIARDETQRLIEAMRDTMRDAPGVGLAAPQVGVPLQIAVIEDREEYAREMTPETRAERDRHPVPFHVIINPELVPDEGDPVEFYEGCLSVPGFTAIVPRARSVTVRCLDENGQEKSIRAQGWYARILQHEIDHLHGTLYLDRMITRSYATIDNFNRHWKALPIPEVRSALAASELDRS